MMMMIINNSENKDRYTEVVENRTAILAFDIMCIEKHANLAVGYC